MTRTDRFSFFGGVVIILRRNNKVLLIRRCNTGWMDGYYAFLGGGIDGGETITQAGIREAYEEAGVKIVPEAVRIAHIVHIRLPDGCECFSFFLEVTDWQGEPTLTEPDKSDDMVWASLDELPENTVPHVRQVLEHMSRNSFFSESGWELK